MGSYVMEKGAEANEIQFDDEAGFTVNSCRISAVVANALFCTGRAALSIQAVDELFARGFHALDHDPAEMELVVDCWGFANVLEGGAE